MGKLNSLPPLGNPVTKKGILAALSKGEVSNVQRPLSSSTDADAINSIIDALSTLGLVNDPGFPFYLFQSGDVGGWYDPSDLGSLFQDTAGTVAVAVDGDPVALMRDKSGNGLDLSQAASSARPIYRTNGTLHWLEFDGVDDQLESVVTPFGSTINEGSVLIAAQEIVRKNQILFALSGQGLEQSTRWWSHCPFSDGNIYFDVGGAAAPYRISAAAPFSAGASFVGTFESSLASSSQSVRINGTALVSDADGASVAADGTLSLGTSHAGTDFANVKVFGMVARVGLTLSSEDLAKAESWLATKAGLTL